MVSNMVLYMVLHYTRSICRSNVVLSVLHVCPSIEANRSIYIVFILTYCLLVIPSSVYRSMKVHTCVRRPNIVLSVRRKG